MLKRGNIEGPFSNRPEPGPLKSLPSYMVNYAVIKTLVQFAI